MTLQEIDANFRKGSVPWYEAAFRYCSIDPRFQNSVVEATGRALRLKAEYIWGQEHTGVPWTMLLGVHHMECGNNPKGCLHNGQLIVGTGRKTTIVPIGRGPFDSFRATIVDAVRLQGLLNSVAKSGWSVGMMLKQMELFNGSGYLRYHPKENSPYLWARTNVNDGTGKYVADGKWSESANADAQVGAAAILKQLVIMKEWEPYYAT